MNIADYDHLDDEKKRQLLKSCCGSSAWVEKMIAEPPYEDLVEMLEAAEEKWWQCTPEDWKEAFGNHPKIGDISSLKDRFASTADWAAAEQSGIRGASDDVLRELADLNTDYENKFGFIFIVCATGKSAQEMLELVRARINNDANEELSIAADEQIRITKLRLEKLFA